MRHLAGKHRGRTIGLYGGSFNPAHSGHIHIANEALRRLDIDEVWFLVSPGNPLKPEKGMASFEARLSYLQELIGNHPKLSASAAETKLGTRYSLDTITALKQEMPETNFVWIMGADNLASFDLWHQWPRIAESLPIAVFDRTGYALSGLASKMTRRYAKYRTAPERLKTNLAPSWTFVTIPRHPASATTIRNRLGVKWLEDRQRKDT